MNKALLALVLISLISLIGLFAVGCKTTIPGTSIPPVSNGNEPTIGEPAVQAGNGASQAVADNSITGQINSLDSLNNDLNDPEIQNTGSLINEVNW